MMRVRLFQQSKTAMQSGQANTKQWVIALDSAAPQREDPLMGWIGSTRTLDQVRLTFDRFEDALAYATQKGYIIDMVSAEKSTSYAKRYGDNFTNPRYRGETTSRIR